MKRWDAVLPSTLAEKKHHMDTRPKCLKSCHRFPFQHTVWLSARTALLPRFMSLFSFDSCLVSTPALSLVYLPTISWLFSPVFTSSLITFLISAPAFHCFNTKSYHAFVPLRPSLVSLFPCPCISSLISWIWPVLLFLCDYLLSWSCFVCLCFDLRYRLHWRILDWPK